MTRTTKINESLDVIKLFSGMICCPLARTCYDKPSCQIWKVYLHL